MGQGAGHQAEHRRFEPGHPLLNLESRLYLGTGSYVLTAIDYDLGEV